MSEGPAKYGVETNLDEVIDLFDEIDPNGFLMPESMFEHFYNKI